MKLHELKMLKSIHIFLLAFLGLGKTLEIVENVTPHHAWRDLNLKVLTNERDLYQACLFTQWSAKMLVPEII